MVSLSWGKPKDQKFSGLQRSMMRCLKWHESPLNNRYGQTMQAMSNSMHVRFRCSTLIIPSQHPFCSFPHQAAKNWAKPKGSPMFETKLNSYCRLYMLSNYVPLWYRKHILGFIVFSSLACLNSSQRLETFCYLQIVVPIHIIISSDVINLELTNANM